MSRVYSRLVYEWPTKIECVGKGRRTIEQQKRQSWRRCNSQEGSGAERLSGGVACCSYGRRETGGIKLLQTITFNEKVNAASRGLARTWMQMCRVISKQSSPPSCCLLFPHHPSPSSFAFSSLIAVTFLLRHERRSGKRSKPTPPFCSVHRCLCVREGGIYGEYTLSLSDIPLTVDKR